MSDTNTVIVVEPEAHLHDALKEALDRCGLQNIYEMREKAPDNEQTRDVIFVGQGPLGSTNAQFIDAPYKLGDLVDKINKLTKAAQAEAIRKIGPYDLSIREMALIKRSSGQSITLTDREGEILQALSKANAPVSKRALLEQVWEYADGVETHTLETHIYRLRQKMEDDPSNPRYLCTNDQGYFLDI